MAHPTYVTDIVALTLAVALAAAVVLLGFHLMQELVDLPPALSGSPCEAASASRKAASWAAT